MQGKVELAVAAPGQALEPCPCGGRFRYKAPARCPRCRSLPGQWDRDPEASHVFYD